jgi:hypothetical protein
MDKVAVADFSCFMATIGTRVARRYGKGQLSNSLRQRVGDVGGEGQMAGRTYAERKRKVPTGAFVVSELSWIPPAIARWPLTLPPLGKIRCPPVLSQPPSRRPVILLVVLAENLNPNPATMRPAQQWQWRKVTSWLTRLKSAFFGSRQLRRAPPLGPHSMQRRLTPENSRPWGSVSLSL